MLDLGPGPDTFKEQEARAKVGDLVKAFARKFCSIALEAQKIYAGSPNIEPVLPESQLYDTSVSRQESIKVSAIVSTYNAEKFIRGCLDDLVNQTLYKKGQLEIIVVNSGSQQNEEARKGIPGQISAYSLFQN